MDILALHQELRSAGFSTEIGDIEVLIAALNGAIADGKVKQSTAPDRKRYPLKHVLQFLRGKDNEVNYLALWNKAIELCPQLANFKVFASYSQNVTHQKQYVTQQKQLKSGILSLTVEGIVLLANVLDLKPNTLSSSLETVQDWPLNDTSDAIDPRIPIHNTQVYILKDVPNKVLKIGVTNDVETRMMQHKSSNPFLVAIAFFPVYSRTQEFELHNLLQPYRIPGLREWYSDIPEVRNLIFQYFLSY